MKLVISIEQIVPENDFGNLLYFTVMENIQGRYAFTKKNDPTYKALRKIHANFFEDDLTQELTEDFNVITGINITFSLVMFLLTDVIKIVKKNPYINSVMFFCPQKYIDLLNSYHEEIYIDELNFVDIKPLFEAMKILIDNLINEDVLSDEILWNSMSKNLELMKMRMSVFQPYTAFLIGYDKNKDVSELFNRIFETMIYSKIARQIFEPNTKLDTEILSKINYSFNFWNDESAFKNLSDEENAFVIDYLPDEFIEFLENNGAKNGLSLISNNRYSRDYLKIRKYLNSIETNHDSNINYNLTFCEALDPKLEKLIDGLITNYIDQDYIYIICNNEAVKETINNEIKSRVKKMVLIESKSDLKVLSKNHNYLYYENMSRLTNTEQRLLWEKINENVLAKAKLVFFDVAKPGSLSVKINRAKMWHFDEEMVAENLSKIFLSFLNEKNNLPISSLQRENIIQNKYVSLINPIEGKFSFEFMKDSINKVKEEIIFDLDSIDSWYRYRTVYCEIFEQESKSKGIANNQIIEKDIYFNKNGDEFLDIEIDKIVYTVKYNKSILYVLLIMKYYKEYQKAIDISQLITISNCYFPTPNNLKHMKERLELKPNIKNDKSTLDSALYGKGVSKYKKQLKDFIRENIKYRSTLIGFNTPNNTDVINNIYNIHFSDIEFDMDLFSSDYKNVIKMKHFN